MMHDDRDDHPDYGRRPKSKPQAPTEDRPVLYEDELRPRRMAFARVVSDRRTPQEVAVELGVSPAQIVEWVEVERAAREGAPKIIKQDAEGEAARKERVRQDLFQRKQVVAQSRHEGALAQRLRQGVACKPDVVYEVKTTKAISVATLLQPGARAAIAMLEADGEIVVHGPNQDLSMRAEWVEPKNRKAVIERRRLDDERDAQSWSSRRAARKSE